MKSPLMFIGAESLTDYLFSIRSEHLSELGAQPLFKTFTLGSGYSEMLPPYEHDSYCNAIFGSIFPVINTDLESGGVIVPIAELSGEVNTLFAVWSAIAQTTDYSVLLCLVDDHIDSEVEFEEGPRACRSPAFGVVRLRHSSINQAARDIIDVLAKSPAGLVLPNFLKQRRV